MRWIIKDKMKPYNMLNISAFVINQIELAQKCLSIQLSLQECVTDHLCYIITDCVFTIPKP